MPNDHLKKLLNIGPRANAMQIVPPLSAMRPSVKRITDAEGTHDVVIHPLSAPTGPGGAQGFRNRAGSTIARPEVTNIYMGPFWGDQVFVEGFSKAIVENGYLDPLSQLNYGTGSGAYMGPVNGPTLDAATVFTDADARNTLIQMLNNGQLHANANSLFVLILPDQVVSMLGNDKSCSSFCGYHDALPFNGHDVAYAVLPSSLCGGCGGEIGDFTAVYAHELAEACTDKVPGRGWVADDGSENGDLEAWILFGWGPPSDPNRYTVQGYYTNERGNTVGQWNAPAFQFVSVSIRDRVVDVVASWCRQTGFDTDSSLGILWSNSPDGASVDFNPPAVSRLIEQVTSAFRQERNLSALTPPKFKPDGDIDTVDDLVNEVLDAPRA